MKYYVIAGEASGDMHAGRLLHELKLLDAEANFRAWGGEIMQSEGAAIVKHYRELAFMGFVEVIKNLRTILRNIEFCKEDILNFKPDVVILVDYPGFNLRIAEFLKKQGIKVFYYISPQIWAWKENRVNKIKRTVDRMFVILPFEKAFYKKHDMSVDFVGHPLIDTLDLRKDSIPSAELFRAKNQLDHREIIAVLPGSRMQELHHILPVMLSVIKHFPSYQFVIAGSDNIPFEKYQTLIGQADVKVIFRQSHALLTYARAGIIKSGTSTLEAALINLPQVVCYRGNAISIWIARQVAKVKYISIVNLILNRAAVKELIQDDCNEENVKKELYQLLHNEQHRSVMMADYQELNSLLGGSGASKRAARLMYDYLIG